MNAPNTYSFGRKLQWLVRREWWEHRGSFFWGPLIAAIISLVMFFLMLSISQVMLWQANPNAINIRFGPESFQSLMSGKSASESLEIYQSIINFMTLSAATWPMIIFGVAVFFYLLSSLYDERRDRSILLWKSLPLSDTQTVLSKYISAMIVAPLSAIAISLAAMLVMGIIISLFVLINGGDPLLVYWQHLAPGKLLATLLGWLPIYILWALPTVGWLMLCSAWARSVPFIWAILLPLLSGITVSMFSLLGYSSGWFWQHIVLRLLTSAWPGSHLLSYLGDENQLAPLLSTQDDPSLLLYADGIWAGTPLLTRPELWIGAVAGIAMIVLATLLRRWRAEA
ncbi:hypothetical protein CO608_04850 [Lysobacteraceae bacterium NML08-0793]|nr:hypothetical protein CO608_04850 [Xanthomonadaceae bacterium NML08-0793]